MVQNGLRHFDVASLGEIELVAKNCPYARMYFMHPVKSRMAITKAYFDYGIRDFVFDSIEEFQKILEATNFAKDLNLIVRVAVENKKSVIQLSSKFGALPHKASFLLKKARPLVKKLGVSFHVGSQCMEPEAYADAIKTTGKIIASAKVAVDIIDVGGGFPCKYPDLTPPSLENYIAAIKKAFKQIPNHHKMELWCEPGRALVAESVSYVVKVELRKKNYLYINDGTFGSLYDAGNNIDFVFPTTMIGRKSNKPLRPFSFYGPTCDSADFMKGPFWLPSDINEGDYIEIGMLGAYGSAMRTGFNGFNSSQTVVINDKNPNFKNSYHKQKVA